MQLKRGVGLVLSLSLWLNAPAPAFYQAWAGALGSRGHLRGASNSPSRASARVRRSFLRQLASVRQDPASIQIPRILKNGSLLEWTREILLARARDARLSAAEWRAAQMGALTVLGRSGAVEDIEAVLQALKSKNAATRRHASGILADIVRRHDPSFSPTSGKSPKLAEEIAKALLSQMRQKAGAEDFAVAAGPADGLKQVPAASIHPQKNSAAPLALQGTRSSAQGGAEPSVPEISQPAAASRSHKISVWAGVAGTAAFGIASLPAAAKLLPAIGHTLPAAVDSLVPGLLIAGIVLFAANQFLKNPRNLAQPPPANKTPGRFLKWVEKLAPLVYATGQNAVRTLQEHMGFEARAGNGNWTAFQNMLRSALRTAVVWSPILLASLLAGSLLSVPFQSFSFSHIFSPAASAAAATAAAADFIASPVIDNLLNSPWRTFFFPSLAQSLVQNFLSLAVVFQGTQVLVNRLKPGSRAAPWLAAVASMGFNYWLLSPGASPFATLSLLATQAVLIYLYARTRSLQAPLLLDGAFQIYQLYSVWLLAVLNAADPSMLVPLKDFIPGHAWIGLAAWAGLYGAGKLISRLVGGGGETSMAPRQNIFQKIFAAGKKALQGQIRHLKAVGKWWNKPSKTPKRLLPLLAAGLFFGAVAFFAGIATYQIPNFFEGRAETMPQSLLKLLAAPSGLLVPVLFLAASLEEFIFRKGFFKSILDNPKKGIPTILGTTALLYGLTFINNPASYPAALAVFGGAFAGLQILKKILARAAFDPKGKFWQRPLFWALVLSSVVFAVVHNFDIDLPYFGKVLEGYSFTWSSLIGRTAMGVFFAGLYYFAGSAMLLPAVAHFASNFLEVTAMRSGLPGLLAALAAVWAVSQLRPWLKSLKRLFRR
ncbi:MAG: CPBP family intramembrane metalloprotease [Elusimicrobia bacterium]|nr:CPBP family intramembrane metalloprotease [Elusimicrobiota bacterium]